MMNAPVDEISTSPTRNSFSSTTNTVKVNPTPTTTTISPGLTANATAGTSNLHVKSYRTSTCPTSGSCASVVQQSVRVFQLLEILRDGDTSAITSAIQEILKPVDSSISNPKGLEGTSILHLAVQCAEVSIVHHVLSFYTPEAKPKLDVNARDQNGNTALHLAAMLGRSIVVKLLLSRNDIDNFALNSKRQYAIDLARTPEIFQQLQLTRSQHIDSLHKEVRNYVNASNYEGLESILTNARHNHCIDINSPDLATDPSIVESGGSLLHEAAKRKDSKLIQLLLFNGADPFIRDKKGKLPQDVTRDDRSRSMLKKLPATSAAQRNIEDSTAASGSPGTNLPGIMGYNLSCSGKESREMRGYLKKWTNYTTGYKLRWFVLEDGVLSYYKHQDDAGSACRGAINMKIAYLYMDPQDKLRFEIHGKSSVKYHLKANHQVEAKRWFWALNNALKWAKDQSREETKNRNGSEIVTVKLVSQDLNGEGPHEHESEADEVVANPRYSVNTATLDTFTDSNSVNFHHNHHQQHHYHATHAGEAKHISTADTYGGDDTEVYDLADDASSQELNSSVRDEFDLTAQSAKVQMEVLTQMTQAIESIRQNNSEELTEKVVDEALTSYSSAAKNLQKLFTDLLHLSKERDNYWQNRLNREIGMRKIWVDNIAKVAMEQEELQIKMNESENKRKQAKRALRDCLQGMSASDYVGKVSGSGDSGEKTDAGVEKAESIPPNTTCASGLSIKMDIPALSDSEIDEDEFFDAIDSGNIEVVDMTKSQVPKIEESTSDGASIEESYVGYEDPPRTRLKLDADNRPSMSLWSILKNMIGKDMTKISLPVTFNEPTSLLQRITEDMEYSELLDTAAKCEDSCKRMVYVACFAASEYASTINRVAKPFNPLLGETFEYVRPDKGYRFIAEQVSHHPPIGAAHAESAKWEYWGESAVQSKFRGKSFDINPLGTWFLRLKIDQGPELYTWKKVTSSVIGIITGTPLVDNYGEMVIRNWKTGDVCTLNFKPRGWKVSSAYQVVGKVCNKDEDVIWNISGRWNDKIYARMANKCDDSTNTINTSLDTSTNGTNKSGNLDSHTLLVWQCHERPDNIPFNLTPFAVTFNSLPDSLKRVLAPTDTRFRPDQRAMEEGEYEFAAEEKNRLEEQQRTRRRERESKGEEFKPQWFIKGVCDTTCEPFWQFSGEYWNERNKVAEGDHSWQGLEEIY